MELSTDLRMIVEKLLRIEDVAEMTGVPVNTLRYFRHLSTNPKIEERVQVGPRSAKLGRRIVYREADVIAWVDEQFDQAAG